MSELTVIGNYLAAGMEIIIAIYAIIGVLFLLGVYALIRLATLAKRLRKKSAAPAETPVAPAVDCDACEKLKEKDAEIAALKEQIKELEARPAAAPVILPEEERTLSESLAVAATEGTKGMISKKSIIEYLSAKYGEKVELNGRGNRTPNGKLLLSDNHFAFTPAGKRVCFTYVYETDEGTVVSLIKLDEPYVHALLAAHPEVRRSAFPKNKAKDWYSVVADATFTEASYYAVLDHAIALIRDEAEAVVEEPAEVSLKESLAAAKESGAVGLVSKKSIINHLAAVFGEKVEVNGRANRTPNGKLLMSDNHFAFAPDGKRVCFTYVYEDDDGKITILLRTTAEQAQAIRAAHKATGAKSAFPKNKERDWYSVVVDDTFTEAGVYAELDRAAMNIIGGEVAATVAEEPAAVSLKESLAAAKESGAVGLVSKKSIIDHLTAAFGEKVEVNGRANRTPNGKLLMSDNHFAFAPDGKRVCFTYVYEDDDGKITILLRTTAEQAQAIRAAHKATGAKSAFPKNKERDWYSVVVDDTFTEAGVYAELDRAAMNIIGGEVAATVAEEPAEVSLKESLAAAKESGVVGVVGKKSVIDYLTEKYADRVEVNGRANRTANGKLLLSDNHFAIAEGKRVCFAYVYEDEGRVVLLVRLATEEAASLHATHKATAVKSAFPKNKDGDWYSVVVDGTFTGAAVYELLDASYSYVLSK